MESLKDGALMQCIFCASKPTVIFSLVIVDMLRAACRITALCWYIYYGML
jgi:hypothetical protein